MSASAKILLAAVAVITVLVIAYFLAAIYSRPVERETVTISGTFICLPHLDTSGPQTLECAFGLRDANANNYALNTTDLVPGALVDVRTNDPITVSGVLTPRDLIEPGNRTLIYDIRGSIHVTSLNGAETTIPEVEEEETTAQQTVTGGDLTFRRPNDFGLATNAEQVKFESVIPPCEEGFDYCLYYNDSRFENTNFESAGLRIQERSDLETETDCLNTLPTGYTDFTPRISENETYSISEFSPLQNAATGHVSIGSLYRLSFNLSCYELETRLGMSRFENFEEGTIEEFTQADQQFVQNKVSELLESVRFADQPETVIFAS